MKKKSFLATVAVAAVSLIGVTACPSAFSDTTVGPSNGDKAALTIGVFIDWFEGEAASFLWKSIMEKEGYSVTLK